MGHHLVEQKRLVGRGEEAFELLVDGAERPAGVAVGFDESPAEVPFVGERMWPGLGGGGEIALVEELAGPADLGIVIGTDAADHESDCFVEVLAKDGPTDLPGVAAHAEALRAEVVGNAAAGKGGK